MIISDGLSEDDTVKIAAQYEANVALGTSGRGVQLHRGSLLTHDADWFLFLHVDSELPPRWLALVQQHMTDHSNQAAYFGLKFDSRQWQARIVEKLVTLRCLMWALPYGDQGLLISRKLYDEVGGYSSLPLFEDVAIIKTLGRKRLRKLPANITSCADKFEQQGFFRRGLRNFKLLKRYERGEDVEKLLEDYT